MNIDLNRLSVRAFIVLVTCQVLLVVLDAAISYGRLISNRAIGRLFNITREDSIPNWFASMQFLLIALVLWVIFLRVRELDGASGGPAAGRSSAGSSCFCPSMTAPSSMSGWVPGSRPAISWKAT